MTAKFYQYEPEYTEGEIVVGQAECERETEELGATEI